MPAMILHFFDRLDPNGATIFECDTDDEFLKSVHLDIERDSMGGGTVTFARKVGGLFSRDIVVPETLVRVVIPAVDSDKYLHGFWINPRQQQVISKDEQGGEGFTFGGPGPKHYLERSILFSQSFTGIDNAVDQEAGIWTWPETASAGRILHRLLAEDAAHTTGPFLPDLTNTFSVTEDSDGVPWTDDISSNQDFTLKIGDDLLKLMWILEDASGMLTNIDLGSIGTPRLQLEAWQEKGRDLTGTAWDTNVVLFVEGDRNDPDNTGNIATDLDVEGSSYRKASHVLMRGDEGQYKLAQRPGWSPGEFLKVISGEYSSSNDDVLEKVGQRLLNRQENGERQIDLRIVPGFQPSNGLYFPGPPGTDGHFWIWDTVSLTTGGSNPTQLDYQDESQAVTGIDIEFEEAIRDTDDLRVARSFEIHAILNKDRKSSNTSVDLAGNRGTVTVPPNALRLCKAATFTDPEPAAFIGALGAGCSNSTTDVTSGYPPWLAAGDLEERVEITSAEDVPVGGTILVGVSTNLDGVSGGLERVVYDEQGNTYIQDAESHQQGTAEYVTQVWRSVLTTAIVTGDYIRYAIRAPGSDNAGGRCIAASAWDNSLVNPTVGTLADLFNATPTVADTPVAAVTFLSLAAADSDGVTGDADWTNLDAYAFQSGTAGTTSGLLTEYLQPGDGQGWTGAIDQSRDWSLVSVGYDAGGTEGGGSVNDGNPDLVGDSKRAARCDHRHDVHRDTEPTADDDFATAGYKLGTIWAVLDDLDAPTEILSVWLAVDVSEGAAIWLEWPTGGSSVVLSDDIPIVESGTGSAGTSDEASRSDHVHPLSSSGSGIGEILISDTPSTPLVFADLIQNEAQDDLVYADP